MSPKGVLNSESGLTFCEYKISLNFSVVFHNVWIAGLVDLSVLMHTNFIMDVSFAFYCVVCIIKVSMNF